MALHRAPLQSEKGKEKKRQKERERDCVCLLSRVRSNDYTKVKDGI